MGRNTRWLIIIPAILFALFAKPAKADVLGNWTATQTCSSASIEVVGNSIILHGPDGVCGGPNWIQIETVIPAGVATVDFDWAYQTNDGAWYDPPQYAVNGNYVQLTQLNIDSGSLSVPVVEGDVFIFSQYSTDTCCQPGHLTISNLSLWVSITSSTTSTTTTTTIAPTSTVPVTSPTTTTVQETTTTESTTTTSVVNSTSSSSVPQTTTTESAPTTTQPPATLPPTPPQTTVPVSVETSAPTTLPETTTSTSTTTVVATTTTAPPPSNTTTTTSTSPSLPPTTTIAPEPPQTTIPAPLSVEEVTTLITEAETSQALVEALADLAPEQVAQVVESILAEEPTQEQATALATSPEVLAIVSTQEAAQIFEALDVTELSDAQTEALVAAVQNAPTEVRQTFEDKIDIFKNALDTYVPVGSNIPVGTRRTLIAVTAGITLAAAGTRIKK